MLWELLQLAAQPRPGWGGGGGGAAVAASARGERLHPLYKHLRGSSGLTMRQFVTSTVVKTTR